MYSTTRLVSKHPLMLTLASTSDCILWKIKLCKKKVLKISETQIHVYVHVYKKVVAQGSGFKTFHMNLPWRLFCIWFGDEDGFVFTTPALHLSWIRNQSSFIILHICNLFAAILCLNSVAAAEYFINYEYLLQYHTCICCHMNLS